MTIDQDILNNFKLYQRPEMKGFDSLKNHINFVIEADYKDCPQVRKDFLLTMERYYVIVMDIPGCIFPIGKKEKVLYVSGMPLITRDKDIAQYYCESLKEAFPSLTFTAVYKDKFTALKNVLSLDRFFHLFS